MAKTSRERPTKGTVVYVRRETKPGGRLFSDLALPDGTIVRHVDEAVHRRALRNASKRFKESLNAG